MFDPITDLILALVALFLMWRSHYWKRKAENWERECSYLKKETDRRRIETVICGVSDE